MISGTIPSSNAPTSECERSRCAVGETMDKLFDLVIKNARVVRPNKTSVDCLDIAIADGRINRLAPDIETAARLEATWDAI